MNNLSSFYPAIGGGLIISLACIILLLFLGKIAGISGIFAHLTTPKIKKVNFWQITFITGILLGSWAVMYFFNIDVPRRENFPTGALVFSGLLVGYGTQLGNGCTSGHGICGIGRISMRSIVATVTFMLVAIVTVFIFRHLL